IRLNNNEHRAIVKVNSLREKRFRKLCIFSHFDSKQTIEAYVVAMLKSLYQLGFDIIFVSTSHKITTQQLHKIDKYLLMSIVRQNKGYDFISWKTGLSFVEDYKNYEMILHINDSIFFPLVNPKKMFDTMKAKKLDCWGLTDSFKQTYHLESFFWVVHQRLLKSQVYENFWNECQILSDKSEIIQKYEMGFVPYFVKYGFKCSAYIPLQTILQKINLLDSKNGAENLEHKRSFNLFWDLIIKDFKAPFIKKKILIKSHTEYNPTTFSYKEVLQRYTPYNVRLIERFLQREESANQYDIEQKSHEFFANMEAFAAVLQMLQRENNLVLYGFGEVGYFIYSNLESNIVKIVDRNYISLSSRYQKIEKFCSIKKIKNSEMIVIAALGREKSIIQALQNEKIDNGNAILIGDFLPCDALKFANNITKLFYNIDALYRLCVENKYNFSFCSSNQNLNKLIKNYLKMHRTQEIEVCLIQDTYQIYFLLFYADKQVHRINFTFIA
ncbi:MAG: hypothetical protein FP820_09005, partial [Sulfurimonas sp.]|nr:hypothetical protein [Sulfurimonas sp.]MBU4057920.1 hypothetical protein [bacterium]